MLIFCFGDPNIGRIQYHPPGFVNNRNRLLPELSMGCTSCMRTRIGADSETPVLIGESKTDPTYATAPRNNLLGFSRRMRQKV
jgi:hypothetical protein